MLAEQENEVVLQHASLTPSSEPNSPRDVSCTASGTDTAQPRLERVLQIEWLGQTIASLCWIASVFTYGISSMGDWLQLLAASSWFVANVAAALADQAD